MARRRLEDAQAAAIEAAEDARVVPVDRVSVMANGLARDESSHGRRLALHNAAGQGVVPVLEMVGEAIAHKWDVSASA